jgi:hypothetical protein
MLFSALFSILISSAKAAPCCAGSTALPSLITGDEAQLMVLALSYGDVIGDAPGAGKGIPVFRDSYSNKEARQNITFNFATLLSDRWQFGTSIPIIQNQIKAGMTQESSTQIGDLTATVGYEALPEWEYSLWKPRIYTFVQWVAPTGRSIEQSQSKLAVDVGGLGYHQLHLGTVAIKRWSDWDANFVLKLGSELSYRSLQLSSSWGVGYSFAEIWRAGLSLESQYQSPQKISGLFTSQKLVWNTGATLTCLLSADSSLVAGYSDQTLFGPAINTTLARTASLSFQHRFER